MKIITIGSICELIMGNTMIFTICYIGGLTILGTIISMLMVSLIVLFIDIRFKRIRRKDEE